MLHIRRRRYILQGLNCSLLLGTLIWVVLNIRGAQVLKEQLHANIYGVTFGPLDLMQLHKQPIENGFTVQFLLEPGIIIYVIFWLIMGVVLGLARAFYVPASSQRGRSL